MPSGLLIWSEAGSAVVAGALAILILMIVFIGALNFVLDEYAKGAIRTAVDDAAEAGATAGGSLSACQTEARQVQGALLPGPFGSGVSVTCSEEGDEMVASAGRRLAQPLASRAHGPRLGGRHLDNRRGAHPMSAEGRSCDERGSAIPLTLLLGTTLIVMPVMLLVLTLPTWEQRAVDAQDAARTAARALVTADNWGDGVSAANQTVSQLVGGDGLALRRPDGHILRVA